MALDAHGMAALEAGRLNGFLGIHAPQGDIQENLKFGLFLHIGAGRTERQIGLAVFQCD